MLFSLPLLLILTTCALAWRPQMYIPQKRSTNFVCSDDTTCLTSCTADNLTILGPAPGDCSEITQKITTNGLNVTFTSPGNWTYVWYSCKIIIGSDYLPPTTMNFCPQVLVSNINQILAGCIQGPTTYYPGICASNATLPINSTDPTWYIETMNSTQS